MTAQAAATTTGRPSHGVPSGNGTGFCRVTVVAPDSRIDVALPEDVAVADLYPEILRLSGQSPAAGAPAGYHLVRRDGTVLDGARTLAGQRILDGELLSPAPLRRVAAARRLRRRLRRRRLRRRPRPHAAGATTSCAAPASPAASSCSSCWPSCSGSPTRPPRHARPARHPGRRSPAVLLLALAGVRARVYDDRASAVALGLGALPHAAGRRLRAARAPTRARAPGRLQFLLGCAAVLVASVILMIARPRRRRARSSRSPSPPPSALVATFVAILGGAGAHRGRRRLRPRRRRRSRLPARPLRPLRPAAHRLRTAPLRRRRLRRPPSRRPRSPVDADGSPPRPAAATSCCSAWSAAAPLVAVGCRRRARLLRQRLGPAARPGHRASPC